MQLVSKICQAHYRYAQLCCSCKQSSMLQGVFKSAAGKRGTIKTDLFSSGTLHTALAAALQVYLVILSYILGQSSSEAAYARVPAVSLYKHPVITSGSRLPWSEPLLGRPWPSMILCDTDACTAQVASCRNVRHLGGNRIALYPSSCLAPGLFSAAATFLNTMQVGLVVTRCNWFARHPVITACFRHYSSRQQAR